MARTAPRDGGAVGTGGGGVQSVAPVVTGRVLSLEPCPDTFDSEQSGSIHHACQVATVEVISGPDAGRSVPVELIGVSAVSGVVPGDSVHITDVGDANANHYALVTVDRLLPLGLFALAFVAVVVAVAGWKGVRGLIGLVVAGAVFFGFMLPAVWELRAAGSHLTRWELFTAGMRIGRDHIASTIYTIVFAYAGAALSTLVLLSIYTQPVDLLLSTEPFAEEIVRTLGSGIGLVLSVPLTTGVAALTVGGAGAAVAASVPRRAKRAHDHDH